MQNNFIALLNEILSLDLNEYSSFRVRPNEEIEYNDGIYIHTRNDKFIITTTDCSGCSGAHYNCEDVEYIATSVAETIEALEIMKGQYRA